MRHITVQSFVINLFSLQGIVGNDGRHYVLDLLRTFPPDANYFPGWEHFGA